MSEKKQLNQEELEKVTGGHGIGENDPHYRGFSGYVGMYSLEKNKEYYFTYSQGCVMFFRALVNDTKEVGFKRKHFVTIKHRGNTPFINEETKELRGDDYAAYTTKNF